MKIIGVILLFVVHTYGYAQKTKIITTSYTYHIPENVSQEMAKHIALERAKVNALAEEFGTLISETSITHSQISNGESTINYSSIGGSKVKGEWLKTIDEPSYDFFYEQGMFSVKVTVKGKIRELISKLIDLDIKVLKNGTDDKYESSEFLSGDDLYLSFQAPVNGNLLVYLVDYSTDNVYCLLPYRNSLDNVQEIIKDNKYVFFNYKDLPPEKQNEVDEYTLTCESKIELNEIVVIFSPNEIIKPITNKKNEYLPRQLTLKDFTLWTDLIKGQDPNLQIFNQLLTIKKQ